MPTFNEYLTDEAIIDELCKARLKVAECAKSELDISRLTGQRTGTQVSDPLYRMFPPRHQWLRFRPRNRAFVSRPDLHALRQAVRHLREEQPTASWALELGR